VSRSWDPEYVGRDLTGAIDGTKNPDTSLRTVVEQASIGPRDYAGGSHLGGSFVFCSKFAHRMGDFHAMPAEEQTGVRERDVSRTASRTLPRRAAPAMWPARRTRSYAYIHVQLIF
jgi:deferrochelatase/peroxidase EfeB